MTKMKTINIKGKQYVTVNERVKAFREHYPEFSLETELIEVTSDTALIRAVIRNPEGRILATGTSFERRDNSLSMVNKTSHVENCETSAWGRALGNLGIGIDESIASAQEVAGAIARQDALAAPPKPVPKPVKTPQQYDAEAAELSRLKGEIFKFCGEDLAKVNAAGAKIGVEPAKMNLAQAKKLFNHLLDSQQ